MLIQNYDDYILKPETPVVINDNPMFPPELDSKTPIVESKPFLEQYGYTKCFFLRDLINSIVLMWALIFMVGSIILTFDNNGKTAYFLDDPDSDLNIFAAMRESVKHYELDPDFPKVLRTEHWGWFKYAHEASGDYSLEFCGGIETPTDDTTNDATNEYFINVSASFCGFDIYYPIIGIGIMVGLTWGVLSLYDINRYSNNKRGRAIFVNSCFKY